MLISASTLVQTASKAQLFFMHAPAGRREIGFWVLQKEAVVEFFMAGCKEGAGREGMALRCMRL
jgi:hypothetical protein